MEKAIISSIVSMAQLAWRTCADAKIYKEECLRIGERLTVVIVITKQWTVHFDSPTSTATAVTPAFSSSRPSRSSLRNLQSVLRNLTLTLQKATMDRAFWTKRVQHFTFSTSMVETLLKVEADLNSALQDFQTVQNNQIIQIVAHHSKRFQRVEEALLHMAEHRLMGHHDDSPSFLQVMDEVLHNHQLDSNGSHRNGTKPSTFMPDTFEEPSYLDDLNIDYLGIEASPLEVDHSCLNYTMKDHLGSGSFGDVYRGTYKNEKVAVKLIRIDTFVDDRRNSIMDRLEKEAMVMARMGIHPNILHLYGFDVGTTKTNGSRPMLVMELMDTTLYAALHSSKTLTHAELIGLMKGIASALEFLHLQGIVHRDIKSLNILLKRHCAIAKLSDFGEAKENGFRSTTAYQTTMAKNHPMNHAGTFAYHSPEILVGKMVGPSRKADIYAFGIVLWECLTRQIPFDGQHDFDIIRHALNESMPYLLEMPHAKSLPSDDAKQLLRLARSCMHRSPEARPNATQAVRQFQAKLVEVEDSDEENKDVHSPSNAPANKLLFPFQPPTAFVYPALTSPTHTSADETLKTTQQQQPQHQKQQLQKQKSQQRRRRPFSNTSMKQWRAVMAVVVVFGLIIIVIAAICGSGHCGSSPPAPLPPISSPNPPLPPPPSMRAISILSFINSITLSGRTLHYPTLETAEERALLWLIDDDIHTAIDDWLALRQRYALAVLWFQSILSSSSTTTTSSSSLSFGNASHLATWTGVDQHECEWTNVVCTTTTTTMGYRRNIIRLNLDNATVRGTIPNDLGLLTSLLGLILSRNELTGTIPPTLGMSLTNLVGLALNDNRLMGTIPSSIGTMTGLTGLWLSFNQLTGTIPSSIGNLTALTELIIRDNSLTGTIPQSLTRCKALTRLWLHNNQLNGTMPFCNVFLLNRQSFEFMVTDCNEVDCDCCTHCCPKGGWNEVQGIGGCDQ